MWNNVKIENSTVKESPVGGIVVNIGSYNKNSTEDLALQIKELSNALAEVQKNIENPTNISDIAKDVLKKYASEGLRKLIGL